MAMQSFSLALAADPPDDNQHEGSFDMSSPTSRTTAVLVCPASATLNELSLVEDDWPFSVSCADYFSGSPNAVVIDGADAASNRYGTPATSS